MLVLVRGHHQAHVVFVRKGDTVYSPNALGGVDEGYNHHVAELIMLFTFSFPLFVMRSS